MAGARGLFDQLISATRHLPVNRFYKTFFTEMPANPAELSLFAFGKHPGWDDHIEAIGIDNDTLAICHSLFYVHGIRGVIDSGVWETKDPVQVVPEFGNLVLWQGRRSFLACRMWPSKDGKGRAKYPMVVGLYGGGVSLIQAFPMIAPVLRSLEDSCREARTADEVRGILESARTRLRESIGTLAGGEVVPPLRAEDYRSLLEPGPRIPSSEGWHRILYTCRNQFSGFGQGRFNPRALDDEGSGEHIRLPLLNETEVLGMLDWLRFFRAEIDPQVPIFLSCHLGRHWCDVLVGEPEPQDFSFLKLNPEGIPFANDIPYNLENEQREEFDQILDSWKNRGAGQGSALFPAGGGAGENGDPKGKGWLRSIFRWGDSS